jgi:hypothetical protein
VTSASRTCMFCLYNAPGYMHHGRDGNSAAEPRVRRMFQAIMSQQVHQNAHGFLRALAHSPPHRDPPTTRLHSGLYLRDLIHTEETQPSWVRGGGFVNYIKMTSIAECARCAASGIFGNQTTAPVCCAEPQP